VAGGHMSDRTIDQPDTFVGIQAQDPYTSTSTTTYTCTQ
jgi:hypothetical protein